MRGAMHRRRRTAVAAAFLLIPLLLISQAVYSAPILSIKINILDQATGGEKVSLFQIHPGELVEHVITSFTERNALHQHHVDELLNAVREASLIQGQALLPLPTLVLAHTAISPFTPPHTNSDTRGGSGGDHGLHTILLGSHLHPTRPQDTVRSSLEDVLWNQSRSGGWGSTAVPTNQVYALVSPDTSFRPGLKPDELFLEYDRLRFAHTGQFSGEFVLVLACSGAPHWNVIMFSSSLLWNTDLADVSTATIITALLNSHVTYRAPPLLARRLLTCHEVDLPSIEGRPLDVMVVVLTQGKDDHTTWGVFQDVAGVLNEGLQDLGLTSTVVICSFLDKCRLPQTGGPQWIILASHNLASYLGQDNEPAVLSRDDLIPPNAVLYNFEHIPLLSEDIKDSHSPMAPPMTPTRRAGSLVTRSVMDVYRKYRVWDYSSANVERFRSHNITATYVPLGFGTSLHIGKDHYHHHHESPPPAFSERQIDVLFYGTVLPRRQRIVRHLRAAGIRVLFASAANNGTFGEELDAYLVDAKVVLNLGAFDDDAEWKMTRFVKPLANRRLIISEKSTAEEQSLFQGGIVFVDANDLVSTCLHYLSHPEEAESVAEEGYRLFSRMKESGILAKVGMVQDLVLASTGRRQGERGGGLGRPPQGRSEQEDVVEGDTRRSEQSTT